MITKGDNYPIVNVYSQETYHADAEICGNKEGLTRLRDLLTDLLDESIDDVSSSRSRLLYDCEGEGYMLMCSLTTKDNLDRMQSPSTKVTMASALTFM
jgi:hypothetical protein